MRDTPRPLSANPAPVVQDRLLTAKRLANLLAVSIRTVWRLDASGKLPRPVRLGGSVRWRHSEIDNWLRAGCPDRKCWELNAAYNQKGLQQ